MVRTFPAPQLVASAFCQSRPGRTPLRSFHKPCGDGEPSPQEVNEPAFRRSRSDSVDHLGLDEGIKTLGLIGQLDLILD